MRKKQPWTYPQLLTLIHKKCFASQPFGQIDEIRYYEFSLNLLVLNSLIDALFEHPLI